MSPNATKQGPAAAGPMTDDLSRREFFAWSMAIGMGASAPSVFGQEPTVVEKNVEVQTPDGICDAIFLHPSTGSHPGVLVWHDSAGLRSAFHELGRRLASEGYAVLVPNLFYRTAKAPVFDASFDFHNSAADREKYFQAAEPLLKAGAAERDAAAYVTFLDTQPQVKKDRKIGTHGYCLGGPYVIKIPALLPDRIGAGASFHGGFLVTDQPDSPHLLAPRLKASLYFAIASDDDQREPAVKTKLRESFAAAKVPAEIEVYPNALHGWCVPDNKPAAENKKDAERAWAKLIALYQSAL